MRIFLDLFGSCSSWYAKNEWLNPLNIGLEKQTPYSLTLLRFRSSEMSFFVLLRQHAAPQRCEGNTAGSMWIVLFWFIQTSLTVINSARDAMRERSLPASPNWYSSRCSDVSSSGLLGVGAKNLIYLVEISAASCRVTGEYALSVNHTTPHATRLVYDQLFCERIGQELTLSRSIFILIIILRALFCLLKLPTVLFFWYFYISKDALNTFSPNYFARICLLLIVFTPGTRTFSWGPLLRTKQPIFIPIRLMLKEQHFNFLFI